MSSEIYYCPRANGGNSGGCKHGGNKVYNYGFVSGTAGYCRLNSRFLASFSSCPKEEITESEANDENK